MVASDLQHPPSLARVTVHKTSFTRRATVASVFVVLYAVSVQWCYNTAGEPLAFAEKEKLEKEIERNRTLAERNATNSTGAITQLTTEELIKELNEISEIEERTVGEGANMTVTPKPLPSKYLPNAWAGALFFLVFTASCLFVLTGHWLVWFKADTLFEPTRDVGDGAFALVRTHAHKGSGALCKFKRSAQAPHRFCFEFQRQRYEYIPAGDSEAQKKSSKDDEETAIVGLGEENGHVRLMRCPVDLPISTYHASRGLDDKEIVSGGEQFGENTLTVPTPKFLELYKQQMISPLVVFQFFTAFLWMLDEYWQFVVTQVVMILALESTTVFQRIKTFGTLNAMSSKPYRIKVFRNKEWRDLSSLLLLPGDLISVKPQVVKTSTAIQPAAPANGAAAAAPATPPKPADGLEENTGVVPCDCLVLHGDAVVNEATLTGESVPLMKDALRVATASDDVPLDIDGAHRVHMLFSGTQIIAANGPSKDKADLKDYKTSPDGGCLCFVVRTGFNSSQGKMIQMIEYSQHKMADDSKETAYALLVLLAFALVAAGYVMKKGLEKGDRTTHELLIKCIIIITATVPKQLPMQMAMAVNTALMGLMKRGVFCTEPFRVPLAGKVNVCMFDKTGTLTTDQLVPVGMINPSGRRIEKGAAAAATEDETLRSCAVKAGDMVTVDGVASKPELNGEVVRVCSTQADGRIEVQRTDGQKLGERFSLKRASLVLKKKAGQKEEKEVFKGLFPMVEACPEALMVVAGCHSLIEVAGAGVMGDPIELAALKGVDWRYDSNSSTALPGNWDSTQKAIDNLEAQLKTLEDKDKKADAEKQLVDARERVTEAKAKAKKSPLKSVKIQHRHHFSSKLQRMSVVAHVDREASPHGAVCLVKGSPEAIRSLLAKDAVPEWYEKTYREMAEHGLRVLALAYKWCDNKAPQLGSKEGPARDWVESDLQFAGFLAFGCKTRADSSIVLRSIQSADIATVMATGDAPLTALHVAKEVSICADHSVRPCLLLELKEDGTPFWVEAIGDDPKSQPFKSPGVIELAKTNDLMVTEAAMDVAVEASEGKLWGEMQAIKVFARMSPQGKAKVIRAMQEQSGACVFMCGDGGNDVGALKQANVGLALLSGYGNTNTTDSSKSSKDPKGIDKSAEDLLNSQQAALLKKQQASAKLIKEEMKAIQAELQLKQKERIMTSMNAMVESGEGGLMSGFGIIKSTFAEFKQELQVRQREVAAKHGSVYDEKKSVKLLKEEMESEMGGFAVRPGDASVAAPFTSRAPSVANIVDIVRQGRCTLLSALQNQQIMMLECVISAYTLSAISLEGGRSSDRQMMATGWLLSIASMAFAFATPIDKMSKIRPMNSLFQPAVFVSMLGQAAIHLGCMVFAIQLATDEMGPGKLKDVVDFHKTQKMIRLGQLCKDGSVPPLDGCPVDPGFGDDWKEWAMSLLNTPFLPNLLNTVTWLVETSQMCAVTFVNYKGRPWMKGLMENHSLFISSLLCIGLIVVAAWELVPQANSLLHLAPFPNDEFRFKVMGLVFMSLAGTFIWDRLCVAIFSPEIMKAMIENAKETTMEDIISVLTTMGKVFGCLLVYVTGNPLIWIGAIWYYRKQKAASEAQAAAAEAISDDLD